MIYVLMLYHLLLYTEAFFLYQKKMRQSSVLLLLINTLCCLLNVIECFPLFSNRDVSSVVFLQQKLTANFFLTFVWILLNLLLLFVTLRIINKAKRKGKQNIYLKIGIYLITLLLLLLFTCVVFSKNADVFLFIYILGTFYILGKAYLKTQKNYLLAASLLLIVFTWYSYFTYEGSARLQIALNGYPKQAYETGMEEQRYYREKNMRKYVPIETVKIKDGEMGIIEIKNYFFIKFGTYNEY